MSSTNSTTDKITGKANELAGQARQSIGKTFDNKEMQAKGMMQKQRATLNKLRGKLKETIKKVIDKA